MILYDNHGLLIKPRNANLENIELRATLDKAVDDAYLNVTERAALNHTFFPKGDGFPLFPKGQDYAEMTMFQTDKYDSFTDTFSKEIKEIKAPKGVQVETFVETSKKGNYLTNLENALNKLKNALNKE